MFTTARTPKEFITAIVRQNKDEIRNILRKNINRNNISHETRTMKKAYVYCPNSRNVKIVITKDKLQRSYIMHFEIPYNGGTVNYFLRGDKARKLNTSRKRIKYAIILSEHYRAMGSYQNLNSVRSLSRGSYKNDQNFSKSLACTSVDLREVRHYC